MAISEAQSRGPEPAATGTPVGSGLAARLRIFLYLLVLFGGALLVSSLIRALSARHEDPPEIVSPEPKRTEKFASHAENLARGDQALLQHRFAEAMSLYHELLEVVPTFLPLVHYRLGLCFESLGQSDKAIASYRKAIGVTSSHPLTVACQLRVASCLMRSQNHIDARKLLSALLLDESIHDKVPSSLVSDAKYLFALSLSRQAFAEVTNRATQEQIAPFTDVAIEIPFYLDEITKLVPQPKKEVVGPPLAPFLVDKRADGRDAFVRNIEQTAQPARQLLDKLLSAGGMKAEWTPQAERQTEQRRLTVHVRSWGFADLVEVIADSLDLICQFEGDVIRFATDEDSHVAKHAFLRRELAQRALAAAIKADSRHALAPASHLEIGSWHAEAGRHVLAANSYARVIRETPASPFVVLAYFNRAQTHLRAHAFAEARKDLFSVVDHAPGSEFALRAHLRLGLLCLEEENSKEAIFLLRRTEKLAPHSGHHPIASLTLAAAYLTHGEPHQVHAILERNRRVMNQPPYKGQAAFLDALARYYTAKGTPAHRREAADVLKTLWQMVDPTLLGPIGYCLAAEAYDEVGFPDQAERLLRQAATHTQSPMMPLVDLKLGAILLKQGQRESAKLLFEKVAQGSSAASGRARFQLARLDLMEKRWQPCIERCRALWRDQSFDEPLTLLDVWGSALEGSGDFVKAARCFAGLAPE